MQGTALHRHTHTILQPLFRLRLETWADFSTRMPARQVGAAVAERLGSSGAGGGSRGGTLGQGWTVGAAVWSCGGDSGRQWALIDTCIQMRPFNSPKRVPPSSLLCTHRSVRCNWTSAVSRACCCLQVEGGAYVPVDTESLGTGAAEAGPPLSAEGGPQRCFKAMYVCTAGGEIDVANWPTHGFGLALVDAYREQLAAWRAQRAQQGQHTGGAAAAAAVQAQPVAAGAAATAAASEVGLGGLASSTSSSTSGRTSGGSGAERVLRVLFQRRDRDRLLLNSAELVEQCNRWRHTTRAGQRLRASCAEVRDCRGHAVTNARPKWVAG